MHLWGQEIAKEGLGLFQTYDGVGDTSLEWFFFRATFSTLFEYFTVHGGDITHIRTRTHKWSFCFNVDVKEHMTGRNTASKSVVLCFGQLSGFQCFIARLGFISVASRVPAGQFCVFHFPSRWWMRWKPCLLAFLQMILLAKIWFLKPILLFNCGQL